MEFIFIKPSERSRCHIMAGLGEALLLLKGNMIISFELDILKIKFENYPSKIIIKFLKKYEPDEIREV